MTLLIVRHGESEGNALGVAQGWRDFALTEHGRGQAAAAASRLASTGAAAVYGSDLRRAGETAEIIGARCGVPVELRAALREQRAGELEGLTWTQATERWGQGLRPGEGMIPGEEASDTFRERVAREFDLLYGRHADDVAVCVSHGGTIRALLSHVLDLPPGAYPRVHLANGAITVVETERGRPVVTSLNDGCHLRTSPA